MKKYKTSIEVLAPLHIGNGLSYFPSSLITLEGNICKRIDSFKLYKCLEDEQLQKRWLDFTTKSNGAAGSFIKQNNIKQSIYNKSVLYRLNILDYPVKTKKDNEKFSPKNEYKEAIKDSCNLFYVPGSSLKGAIRTAILYNRIKSNPKTLKDIQINNVEDTLSFNIEGERKKDSIMRFLLVSDSLGTSVASLRESRNIGMAEGKGALTYCECIDPGTSLVATLDLIEEGKTEEARKRENCIDIDYLRKCLHEFANDILDYMDEKLVDKMTRSKEDLDKAVKQLQILREMNTLDAPLCILGRYKGFFANTVSLLCQNLPIYKDILGRVPHPQRKNHKPETFPVSLNMFVDNEQNFILPGWAKLRFEEAK